MKAITWCRGATDTEYFDVGPGSDSSIGERQSPDQVVAVCLKGLDKPSSPPMVISGFRNAAPAKAPRLLSREATIRASRRVMAG